MPVDAFALREAIDHMCAAERALTEAIRKRADIVALISERSALERSGRVYKGLCPFHAENTPSFHVDPESGFFHCFGCGAGGDVFKFFEKLEGLTFEKAVLRVYALQSERSE